MKYYFLWVVTGRCQVCVLHQALSLGPASSMCSVWEHGWVPCLRVADTGRRGCQQEADLHGTSTASGRRLCVIRG